MNFRKVTINRTNFISEVSSNFRAGREEGLHA